MKFRISRQGVVAVMSLLALSASLCTLADVNLLNVSYDPTREFYKEYNQAFARYWQSKAHERVTVQQSHGGSGKQARSVIDGLEADVVTLGIGYDLEALQKAGAIAPDWRTRLPNNAAPYTSTIVFVVRKGNPKGVRDWADLVKPGVSIIASNPKVSGGGRWTYLAAWGYARSLPGGNDTTARDFVTRFYRNVPVLDSGARASTTSFAQRGLGDVLISWENEAFLTLKAFGSDKYDIVYPSVSILAEPPVSVVDRVVDKHHTRPVATAYLQYLYSPEGQAIAAKHFYRPRDPKVARTFSKQFPPIKLFTFEKIFTNWEKANSIHFADKAIFDQIVRRH